MFRKQIKCRGISVISSLIVLWAVVGYGVAEWHMQESEPRMIPVEKKVRKQLSAEKVEIPAKGAPIRVLTLNAGNYFVPEDPRRSNYQVKYKPIEAREAVAELVAQSRAEIVGLCEMGGEAAVRDLQMRLKRKEIQFPHQVLVMRDGEDRGLALLSKYPIVKNNSVENVCVTDDPKRKKTMLRGILDATVSIPDGRLFRLLGIHLKSRISRNGSAEDIRQNEAYALRNYLNDVLDSQEGMPVLLYGDFNDGPADTSVQIIQGAQKTKYRLSRLKPRDSRGETWTLYYGGEDTYHSFDHILLNNTLKSRLGRKPYMGILDSSAAKQASDHRGVWLELK